MESGGKFPEEEEIQAESEADDSEGYDDEHETDEWIEDEDAVVDLQSRRNPLPADEDEED